MLSSVLIANRGEIAVRVIRTARRLGMRTIAVHSDADRDALFVRMADEAHRLGPAPASESYLKIDAILDIARSTGAACIHPGYGFLSERAAFARACAEAGIVFVGPPAEAIDAMGLKDAAKSLVQKAGVPVVPGYHGSRQEPDFLRQKAYEIGYPVLIKAVAGGGGKGMRRVDKVAEFDAALASAQREAQASFGDPRVLVEKYVLSPRHVEIQVFADTHGNVVHLNERDCSLQRRHQKVIEEAPAPGMTPEVRDAMGRAAVEAARAVGYVGAGTVEFIADGREGLRADRFYFMEMNTRLQVEHPVTEAITGLDLVELQFRVASGEPLPFTQEEVPLMGHAVEARLYAEDPERGFLPSTGRLFALSLPEGEDVRVDAGVEAGDQVTPFYDPMIAKIITRGESREEALAALSRALGQTVVAGPRTNAAFLARLVDAPAFRAGTFDTGFIDANLEALGAVPQEADPAAIAAGALSLVAEDVAAARDASRSALREATSPWLAEDGFQLMGLRRTTLPLLVDGERLDAHVSFDAEGPAVEIPGATATMGEPEATLVEADGDVLVLREGRQTRVGLYDPASVDLEHLDAGGLVKAPMHGKVVALFVSEGERVEKGQRLAVVEAMKMEHPLTAPMAGTVSEIAAAAGDQVAEGARILVIATDEEG
ncbi:acetyl-CoA carboxylase biotin carboxylase subunit [Salinarimonas ramus]|uniref:Biotin carboxylase subunit of acetyl-CoA carboxylase n=1 Tax=Salinarimonas ramus TaxID=690164 RepID=A0A917QGN9_9HYPH|nr:acetyl-CoA carboxylase biotin carboxylase subunit [Salinarimonas ramus]GGK49831.1 biotin carboxylase subunit of acetyl-CoA carboxylase [Salinarimonas ramus]